MSKSIVKKALEIIDDDDVDIKQKKSKSKFNSIKKSKKKNLINDNNNEKSSRQDRKQLAHTCSTLKQMSKPVVSFDQIEQLNNYRFGGPSKRDLQRRQKKDKEENIFTEEDFKRFELEYNVPLQKS